MEADKPRDAKASNLRLKLFLFLAVILVMAVAFVIYALAVNKAEKPTAETNSLEGKVTLVKKGCNAKSIDPNEDVKQYAICDSGNLIRVDDKIVVTSEGGPNATFSYDIDDVGLGDQVRVTYVLDEDSNASLDCETCSLKSSSR